MSSLYPQPQDSMPQQDRRIMRRTRARGRDRGGRRRGEKAQDFPEELPTQCGKRGRLWQKVKKSRQESIGSVDVDLGCQNKSKETDREAQGAQGLNKNCREGGSSFSPLIRGFRSKCR